MIILYCAGGRLTPERAATMGMKQRKCDSCGKRKRFDADKWKQEGWSELSPNYRMCPSCTKIEQIKKFAVVPFQGGIVELKPGEVHVLKTGLLPVTVQPKELTTSETEGLWLLDLNIGCHVIRLTPKAYRWDDKGVDTYQTPIPFSELHTLGSELEKYQIAPDIICVARFENRGSKNVYLALGFRGLLA